jgi:uncharacterized membrane protein
MISRERNGERRAGHEVLFGCRVLLAGESWITHGFHAKGAVSYTTASYEEGGEALIAALSDGGANVTYIPNHLAVEGFPRDEAELAQFDVVILSDIASDTLLLERACFLGGTRVPNRLEALARYVEGGAGLLMVGGYMSFGGIGGKAHYGMTPLARVLPVEVLPGDDRVEVPEGVIPSIVASDHPIMEGLAEEWPYLLGYNRLRLKEDAQLLMMCGRDPLLVVHGVGTGRAGAFASDCSPHWGSSEFIAWPRYGQFWAQLVAWLANLDTGGAIVEAPRSVKRS